MHRTWRQAAGVLVPIAMLAGCKDNFLTTRQAAFNPNFPSSATTGQLFVGVETSLTMLYTSDFARTICMWMQQCAGTDRQYKTLGIYSYAEDAYNTVSDLFYPAGGLIDIRRIEAASDSNNDKVYGGIARVQEVLVIGLAADLFGDVPYSKALGDSAPPLDPQQQVYAALQSKLDTAVTLLSSNQGAGPGALDIFYSGDHTKWLHLAHTLKARYYLHVAERDPSAYAKALTEAQQGLQKGEDFLATFGSNPNENNPWYQFVVNNRAGYLSPGKYLIDLMRARNDPRLAVYFTPAQAGAGAGQYVGYAPNTGVSTSNFSQFNGATASNPLNQSYRQPLVTWAENQLIIAEAALNAGNQPVADQAYNAERSAAFGATYTPVAGVALQDVMLEKYIVLFQNVETWNDYKRTCIPPLKPATGTVIPGRLLYPQDERNANPSIPEPADQPVRNWNDPNACPAGPTF